MKLLATITALVALPDGSFARWFVRDKTPTGCSFTLKSSGSIICPVGQLEDGQIRLNGSYPTTTFYIDPEGRIKDDDEFGCIVTEPPTTQWQCDHGKEPAKGFSIDESNNLLYHGSAEFWACPATDTEYNIYVKPDFGQSKCVPISLTASGCGSPEVSTCLSASTIWQTKTRTVTEDVTQTVTAVVTHTPETCEVAQSSSIPDGGHCKECTKVESSSVPPGNATESPVFSILPISSTLAKREPGVKNARQTDTVPPPDSPLYREWREVKENTNDGDSESDTARDKWVETGEVRWFDVVPGRSLRVGTDHFYGCTVWIVVGPRRVFLGHHAYYSGNCWFTSYERTRDLMTADIFRRLEGPDVPADRMTTIADAADFDCPQDAYCWYMGSVSNLNAGPAALREWMGGEGLLDRNIRYSSYPGGASIGPTDGPQDASGKALIKVDPDETGATIRVYMAAEEPRLELRLRLNENGRYVMDENRQVIVSAVE